MRTNRVLIFVTLALLAMTAAAQNNRSFVSTTGNDANTCTPGNECRSFTRAMAVTNPGGEIIAITSGGYGPFTITKSITVMGAPGIAAELTVTSGDGIDVFAGSTDLVVLRGLNINLTGGLNGISASGFGKLFIENCSTTGASGSGIFSGGGSGSFTTITGTTVRRAAFGIVLANHAAVSHSIMGSNANAGLYVEDGIGADGQVSAADIVIVDSSASGAYAVTSGSGHIVELNLDRALISGNGGDGVVADDNGHGGVWLRVTNSTAAENGAYGLTQVNSAFLGSMKNNLVEGNGVNPTFGTVTPLTAQ